MSNTDLPFDGDKEILSKLFPQNTYDFEWYSWWDNFKDNDPRYWSKDMVEFFDAWESPMVHVGGYTNPVPNREYIWSDEEERIAWYKKVTGKEPS